MAMGGLKRVRPEIQIHFNEKVKKKRQYKDKFTKKLPSLEDVKKKHGVVVWCKYIDCKYNSEVKGLQRTSGTLLKNKLFKPIAEQEAIWPAVCTRDEIAISYDEVYIGAGKFKIKVPSCFTASTKKTGHFDFSSILQGDGSPIGGNTDSQHVSDIGYGALDPNSMYD